QSSSSAVEIHVRIRRGGQAGDALTVALELSRALGSPAESAHQHIPVPLPGNAIEPVNLLDRLRLVDYWRRVNMVADMEMGLDQRPVGPRFAPNGSPLFGSLKARNLMALEADLLFRGGEPEAYLATIKYAGVGFRGGNTYEPFEAAANVIGFELRTLAY